MNGKQRRDPFLLDQVFKERRLTRLRNILEGESEEPVVWIPRELFRFLSSRSKDLIFDRKTRN
jgi:hypothetical protein